MSVYVCSVFQILVSLMTVYGDSYSNYIKSLFFKMKDGQRIIARAAHLFLFFKYFLAASAAIPFWQKIMSHGVFVYCSEHATINGYKCLFSIKGFSGARLHVGFPPVSLVSEDALSISIF